MFEIPGRATDIEKLRSCIRQLGKPLRFSPDGGRGCLGAIYDKVKMDCYNKQEVDELRRLLTPEERKLVIFSWLEWPVHSSTKGSSQ